MGHGEAAVGSEQHLYLGALAGVPASNCAQCADDRGCADGLRKNDRRELVSRRTDKAGAGARPAHQRLFRQSGHLLEKRAGCILPRGAGCAPGVRVSDGYRRGGASRGRPVPRARGRSALLSVPRRLPSAHGYPRPALFVYADEPAAGERASDRRQPRPLPACGRGAPAGRAALSDRYRAAPAEPHGAFRLRPPLRHGADGRADRRDAVFQRGLVFRRLSESAHAFRARNAAGPQFGYLYDVFRRHDRPAAAAAAGIPCGHGPCG